MLGRTPYLAGEAGGVGLVPLRYPIPGKALHPLETWECVCCLAPVHLEHTRDPGMTTAKKEN